MRKGKEIEDLVRSGVSLKKDILKKMKITENSFKQFRKYSNIRCVNGGFGNVSYEIEQEKI